MALKSECDRREHAVGIDPDTVSGCRLSAVIDTSKFLTIGEFSALTRISVRMLRYYDTHGVLCPAYVDDETGYRWYSIG
jgi:hypothetical protein